MAKIDSTALALKQMSSKWKYVPYISILCFILEMIGLGIWNQAALKVVKDVRKVLELMDLALEIDGVLSWGKTGVQVVAAFTVLLNLCGVGLNFGRYTIAYEADKQGQTHSNWRVNLWLMFNFLFLWLWWLLTLFTILLLLASCAGAGASYALVKAAQVGINSLPAVDVTGALNTTLSTSTRCGVGCLDFSPFELIIPESMYCICKLDRIPEADDMLSKIFDHMENVAIGNVMMVLVGTWILMIAASEFGVTRRERTLLRRAVEATERNLAAEAAGLLGGMPNSGGEMGPQQYQQLQQYQQWQQYQQFMQQQRNQQEQDPQQQVQMPQV